MSKRWNGRKMSHGRKNLTRPAKDAKLVAKQQAKQAKTLMMNIGAGK
jgi:hypothetical protein